MMQPSACPNKVYYFDSKCVKRSARQLACSAFAVTRTLPLGPTLALGNVDLLEATHVHADFPCSETVAGLKTPLWPVLRHSLQCIDMDCASCAADVFS